MKKLIIYSLTATVLFLQTIVAFAGNNPHGHKYYVKHNKHHKAVKIHKPRGIVDATYR
jgi:hypothetical protein